jgi:hypothetical protein
VALAEVMYPGSTGNDGGMVQAVGPWGVMGGVAKMPDGQVLKSTQLVEWIESGGQVSRWSTGNNYAVPGTAHAESQRVILDQYRQYLPADRNPQLVTGTVLEFLEAMAK